MYCDPTPWFLHWLILQQQGHVIVAGLIQPVFHVPEYFFIAYLSVQDIAMKVIICAFSDHLS